MIVIKKRAGCLFLIVMIGLTLPKDETKLEKPTWDIRNSIFVPTVLSIFIIFASFIVQER